MPSGSCTLRRSPVVVARSEVQRCQPVRSRLLLAQCDGLTYKQIAQQMGVSLRSVERYVAEALYHCYVLRYEA